jgi:crossover junction endodeoxyribonuclease RusA
MKLDLPYPAKALWPNGRAHHMAKAREVKKHRAWAHIAACEAGTEARRAVQAQQTPIPVTITVFGKPRGVLPDADNASAAAKAYIDGLAARLDINDRYFAAPKVRFADARTSRFVIEVGHG